MARHIPAMFCVYRSLLLLGICCLLLGIIGYCDSHLTENDEGKENLGNTNDVPDIVDVKLFYEAFCPHCVHFERNHFDKVVQVLSHRLFIHTYPYGNANTTVDAAGDVKFQCQHGARECYGNTIHACALNHIANRTHALLFNVCMMGINGSDDVTAEKCAKEMNINISPILQCAKGDQGTELLRYLDEESKKAAFKHVPFVLVNGVHWNGTNFMQDLCSFFKNPPTACLLLTTTCY